ncbi:TadE/TadG family type IV pilus assembly protein [Alteribacillus iranensis]|uniref:TadE-like protein n=1 Tax=Alteribacillus iranensis TaxID=930128 RepID=A0A1I2D165_9BACI|nr:TadE family protein [Alteribacillus iranensis]SFE74268.1 TadE-like protein [Alteribacillus iranensis]
MNHLLKYVKNERGSQLIEFVAIFPLIIFAFLFVWQMALAAYTFVVAEGAARDGARVASVSGIGDTEAIASSVQQSARGLDVLGISPSVSSGSYGEEVHVDIEVALKTINVPFVGELDYEITGTATMPYEYEENP